MIHRLIAMTFLGMPVDSKNTVNHKDLNKSNNAPDNLEWLSLTENIRHASKLIPRLRGEENRSKLTESNVKAIRDRYIPRQTTLKQLAEEYGVSEQTVHAIVHRKKWAHV
jgi:predicted DNA binding protein